jgi:hypothetical protein
MIGRGCCSVLLALACCSPREDGGERQQNSATGGVQWGASHRKSPPQAFLQREDQERARRNRPGELPCSRTRVENGETVESMLPTDECVRMLPRQRFKGIWFNRFEASVFWPDRISIPDREPPFWLSVQDSSLAAAEGERAYLLEFEGRRTMYPGSYGYGDYEHEIIVDRVISAQPVAAQR